VVVSRRRLVVAVVLAPSVWLTCLALLFALVPWACRHPSLLARLLMPLLGVVAVVVSGAAMRLAWPAWRSIGVADENGSPDDARSRFLSLTGIGLGALFMLAALASMIPTLVLGPCD
jgi:hypothetical protein